MAPFLFAVNIGVHSPDTLKEVKEDILTIPGVVEVCPSLVTGRVGIIGMTDPATLKSLLETKLSKPAVLVADLGAAPAPPVGRGYGVMPPPGVYPYPGYNYNPYVGYAAPPPQAGYYNPPVGGRPWGPPPHCTRNDALAAAFEDDFFEDEDEDEYHKRRCCSIQ